MRRSVDSFESVLFFVWVYKHIFFSFRIFEAALVILVYNNELGFCVGTRLREAPAPSKPLAQNWKSKMSGTSQQFVWFVDESRVGWGGGRNVV